MKFFPQNVIAIIWDFDKTLIPGYMETPLFNRFQIDEDVFWEEVDGLEEYYREREGVTVAADTLYLNHILAYVRRGLMPGLNNEMLKELGGEITFYDGMPEFMGLVSKRIDGDARFAEHQIRVEHHILSSGLRQMILGSAVAPYVQGVWGCEFAEEPAEPGYLLAAGQRRLFSPDRQISEIVYTLDNTTKTRAVFEINKGSNVNRAIDVNAKIAHEDRRVPFQNMIYVADGPSDVPVFSVVQQNGGRTYAVYRPGSNAEFEQVNRLLEQDRVDAYGPADYGETSQTSMWISHAAEQIALRIVRDRRRALADRLGAPPTHLG